jgi:tetratricopeptide (TPR) repeat protein
MPEDKIQRFAKVVAQNPDNELARYSLGTAYLEEGRHEEADPHFARALELKDDWVLAYILRARCLIRLGRTQLARELLARGRTLSIEQKHEAPVEEIDEILEDLPPAQA